MSSLGEILYFSFEFLKKEKILDFKRSAEEIIAFVLGIKRLDLYLDLERKVFEREIKKIKNFLKRRAKKEPLEYIFSKIDFYNLKNLKVTKDVLIPRVETEILVDLICKELEGEEEIFEKSLWDIGTGSGCIAIALKKSFPSLKIFASDNSSKALKIAKENSFKKNAEIIFKKGDFLKPFKNLKADFIVCNPPYVSGEEYKDLSREILDFEPKGALVARDRGFYFYKEMKGEILKYSKNRTKLFFEIGKDMGEKLKEIFSEKYFKNKKIIKDFAGHDRFFFVEVKIS
jgi:release factor glutamine methyltransferase